MKKTKFETEIGWTNEFISPEEREKGESLESEKVDEQIVWQLGMIGLYLIFGKNLDYRKIKNDKDINWVKVKETVNR